MGGCDHMLTRIMVVLLCAIVLFGLGYTKGVKQASVSCAADQAKAQQAAQTKVDETNTRREQVAQTREVSRESIRVVYRTIKEKADEKPVAADCGLDADSLRLWNAANSGDATHLSGEPDYTLPAAATGQIGTVGRLVPQPHRIDGAGYAVPRPVGEAGSVREGGQ